MRLNSVHYGKLHAYITIKCTCGKNVSFCSYFSTIASMSPAHAKIEYSLDDNILVNGSVASDV